MDIATLTHFKKLKAEIKAKEEELNKVREKIIEQLDGESKKIVGQYVVTYTDKERTGIDKELLESKYHEIFEECKKTTTYKELSVK